MSESLVHALSGSVGGAAAMAVTYPLEQVRTLLQAGESVESLSKKGGPRRLYQGCGAVLETVAVSNFLYFYSMQYLKELLKGLAPMPQALAASTLAAAANTVLTEPLWKANTVLKTLPVEDAKKETLLTVLTNLSRKEGIKSLWSGTAVSLWLVSNPIIQFTVYEYAKSRILKRTRKNLSAKTAFLVGAFSKALATVLTYPLQIAQTRLRVDKTGTLTMLAVLAQLRRDQSLFRGCQAKLAQTVLTAAFMFAFYERISQVLFRVLVKP